MAKRVLLHVLATLIAVIWIFPLIWLLSSSFKDGSELFRYPLTFLPTMPTVNNYLTAIRQFNFLLYTYNTAFITAIATLLTLLISCMCGYALAKYDYKWLKLVFMALLSTTMLPTEIIMRPSFAVLHALKLYDSLWGCIIPTIGTMTGVFLMRQFFITVPNELMESARIDGAGEWTIFSRIMVPLCKSQVAILAIFSFQWRWNDYIWPLLALRTPEKYTLQLALRTLSGAEAVNWTVLLAASVLTVIPILVMFLVFNKQIMNSNMSSGVKG